MNKMIKRVTSLVLLLVILTNCNAVMVYAGLDKPKANEVWDLSEDGKYTGSGYAEGSVLYSNYYYTGVSKMKIVVTNYGNKNLKVKMRKKGAWFGNVSSATIPPDGETTWTVKVDKSKKYYLSFSAPSDFSWSIQKG